MPRWTSALLLAALCVPAPRALAFEVSVSPAVVEVDVAPGEAATFPVTVVNRSHATVPLDSHAWDLWYDASGRTHTPPGTQPRSAASWLAVVPSETSLPPGQSTRLLATVSVPPEAEGGGYATLFITTRLPDVAIEGTRARLAGRMGVSVLVDVEGTTRREIAVRGIDFQPPTATRPGEIRLHLENTSNTHLRPRFNGLIRTSDGEILGRMGTQPGSWRLPGEDFTLTATWSGLLEPGGYELVGTVVSDEGLAVPVVTPLIVPDGPAAEDTSPHER